MNREDIFSFGLLFTLIWMGGSLILLSLVFEWMQDFFTYFYLASGALFLLAAFAFWQYKQSKDGPEREGDFQSTRSSAHINFLIVFLLALLSNAMALLTLSIAMEMKGGIFLHVIPHLGGIVIILLTILVYFLFGKRKPDPFVQE
ncbi:MAG TPA: hypothetical protein PLD25_08890 [Chloroflexota bacterium]|nr:hypothetical protein [Chloroflexota bacterium]